MKVASVRLGEETVSAEERAELERQEGARSLLSRRAHLAAEVVDRLGELVAGSTEPAEKRLLEGGGGAN